MMGVIRFKEAVSGALNRLDDKVLATLAYAIEAHIEYYKLPECERKRIEEEIDDAARQRAAKRFPAFHRSSIGSPAHKQVETGGDPERRRKHGPRWSRQDGAFLK